MLAINPPIIEPIMSQRAKKKPRSVGGMVGGMVEVSAAAMDEASRVILGDEPSACCGALVIGTGVLFKIWLPISVNVASGSPVWRVMWAGWSGFGAILPI